MPSTSEVVPEAISEVQEMKQRLAAQAKRLKQLKAELQQARNDKANLQRDFQHVLDLIPGLRAPVCVAEELNISANY